MNRPANQKPPRWASRLLTVFLNSRALEASLGDLEEKFHQRLQTNSPLWKARLLFALEALGFLRMARMPKYASVQRTINLLRHTFMFLRRLVKRDPGYYTASLLGLTFSLTSFILIMFFIQDEISYDQFHAHHNRLYRLNTHLKISDVEYHMATSAFPAAAALQSAIPEIEKTVRVLPDEVELSMGHDKFLEKAVWADTTFFQVFSFPFLSGNPETALRDPGSIILTETTSQKYFGAADPLGKTIQIYGKPLIVTGVIRDVPRQSHLQFEVVVPLAFQLNAWKAEMGTEGRENKWLWIGSHTYVLLKEGIDKGQAVSKLPAIVGQHFPDRYKLYGALDLLRVTDIHLNPGMANEMEPGGNLLHVRLFSVVAFVILLVSGINLVNLSSFKISNRMREVGIRKFLGQNALRIVAQLSLESVLIGLLAFSIAVLLSLIFLPRFNTLVRKELDIWSLRNLTILVWTFAGIVAICLTAVIRPALRYATRSSYLLLSRKMMGSGSAGERNLLIGMQVCFSFVMLVFSFIVSSQIDFFKSKDLGFNRKNVVVVEFNEDIYGHEEAFKQELKKDRHILSVSGGAVPGGTYNGWRFVPEGGLLEKPFLFPVGWVDKDYLETLGIKLLAGENFKEPKTYEKDSLWPFMINKRAAIELGWMDNPINRKMKIFAAGTTEIMAEGRVIGVMDDYHFESLHKPVKPIVLTVSPGFGTLLIRTSGKGLPGTIGHIRQTWRQFSGKPFDYQMLDQKLDKLYANEANLSDLMLFFTLIALYLTCYGMFAMSSLLFSSRLKEVAIRKVLGASKRGIIQQFYSRYAVFNLLAIAAGVPIAMYAGNLWLRSFQYRIDLSCSFFIKAGLCILVVGLLSVSYYLVRVTLNSPVKFLRSE